MELLNCFPLVFLGQITKVHDIYHCFMNKLHATNHNVQERETKVSYVVHVPKTATSCLTKRNSIPYHGSLAEWLNQRETPIEKILKAFYIIEVAYQLSHGSMNRTRLNSGAA